MTPGGSMKTIKQRLIIAGNLLATALVIAGLINFFAPRQYDSSVSLYASAGGRQLRASDIYQGTMMVSARMNTYVELATSQVVLGPVVDELQLDVYAFGILSDFRTRLFPGSQRLIELADRVESLPLGPLCWCGARGTHNARTVDGLMVTEGSQVVVGDTAEGGEVRYEVLCRAHHRRRVTARRAKATLSPDPLPFDPEDF